MKLKDLQIGDKFHSCANPKLILVKGNEVLVGKRHLIACKSQLGILKLNPEIEVIKL